MRTICRLTVATSSAFDPRSTPMPRPMMAERSMFKNNAEQLLAALPGKLLPTIPASSEASPEGAQNLPASNGRRGNCEATLAQLLGNCGASDRSPIDPGPTPNRPRNEARSAPQIDPRADPRPAPGQPLIDRRSNPTPDRPPYQPMTDNPSKPDRPPIDRR